MYYTRRTVLRDVTRLSMAAAASTSLPFLSSCRHKPSPDPKCIGDDRDVFCPGIRIFFIGAWVFCKDPARNGMLAVTRDMSDPAMSHTFPYGVWQGSSSFDTTAPRLCPNPSGSGSPRNAYPVTIEGSYDAFESVNDLFSDAAKCCAMSYISNPKHDVNPDFTSASVRVVSFPFPTRLITAGCAKDSYVQSHDSAHPIHSPANPHDTKSGEVAAAYLFEYMGASGLSFNGVKVIGSPSPTYQGDFHFHTVPPPGLLDKYPDHASEMFKNLMSLVGLDTSQVTLTLPHPDAKPFPGKHIPKCVDETELDIPYAEGKAGDTASCAGGGHGIGHGG